MPQYKYKCKECNNEEMFTLNISSDPSRPIHCPMCQYKDSNGDFVPTMTRRIIVSSIPNAVGKVWAGDWYKKTYGHDIGEGAQGAVDAKKNYEQEKMKLKADGVNIAHKSRQIDGKDRISIKKREE